MPQSLTTSERIAGRHSGAALSAPIFSAASPSTLFFFNLRAQRAQRTARRHLNQASSAAKLRKGAAVAGGSQGSEEGVS